MPVFDPANYSLSVYSLPMFLVGVSMFLLGVFVLLREHGSTVSIAFFAVTLTATIWLICQSIAYSAANDQTGLWWCKTAFIGVPFIAPALYWFATTLLDIQWRRRWIIVSMWAMGLVYCIIALSTGWLVTGVQHYWWGYYGLYSWLGLVFLLFFGSLLTASMMHFWRHYRVAPPGRRRRRLGSLMFAFAIGYFGAVDFLATYHIPLYPFGYLPVMGFVLLAARTLWTYRLADITPAFAAGEIVSTMSDAVLVLDREGALRVVNRAASEIFGLRREALLGKSPSQALGGQPFPSRFDELLQLDRVRDYDARYRRPDGAELALSLGVSVMRDHDGEPEAVVLIARDVTEHRRAEEEVLRLNAGLEQRVAERTAQLQTANEELQKEILERQRAEEERSRLLVLEQAARTEAESAVRAREVLLSVVSHDLRNLLTAVRGSTRLLQRMAPPDPPMQTTLARVEAASTRMNSMINELLDFSRLQARQPLDLYRQRVDLVALANQVADYHRQGNDRHEIKVVSREPSVVGLWDPPRIERVLDNLLSNAIKYSPRGGEITVEIRVEGEDAGKWAVLMVRDQGVGIPAEDLPHVFDWFHRAANVSGRIKGSGIGLTSVRQVVEQHGGTVEVESKVHHGTTFTVRLPV